MSWTWDVVRATVTLSHQTSILFEFFFPAGWGSLSLFLAQVGVHYVGRALPLC